MKNLFLTLALSFFSVVIYAQETNVQTTPVSTEAKTTVSNDQIVNTVKASNIAHSKISKVAFYEALLLENDFKIHLNDSDQLVIRNIEQIISKRRNQKLYSELDQE